MTELRNLKVTAVGSITNNGIDDATQTLQSISYAHHEIHGGKSYTQQDFATVDSGGEFNLGFTTENGSKWAHLTFEVLGTGQTEVKIYEGATLSGGTALSPPNRNRNAPDTSVMTITSNPVVSGSSPTSGTKLIAQSFGLDGTPVNTLGGGLRGDVEMILKSGTTYLLSTRSATAGNIITGKLNWYEHTDKVQQF